MRSWVLLLLLAALSAARLRLGSAEDPIPTELVDLVRNSPISSVDELKLLLQEVGGAEEVDEDDVPTNHSHGRHTRSLMEAQPAQQAACKVRTEVMEVTRSMLDRRNANFLLWPPCVEVQRCSGCCNTRLLQCVPTVTSSRYLQVIKIQYINRKAHYDKAVISVDDHVSCRCQPPSPVPVQSNPPPAPAPAPSFPIPRTVHPSAPKTLASKADLHRHDDLKHNQQQPVARGWQQGSYTQLMHWTQPRVHQPAAVEVLAWPSEAKAGHSVMATTPQVGHGSGYGGSREDGGVHVTNGVIHVTNGGVHATNEGVHAHMQQHQLRTQYRLNVPQSDDAAPQETPPPPPPTSTNQRDSLGITEVRSTNQRGGEREESGSANSGDSARAEPANQRKETDSEGMGWVSGLSEEERRKVVEVVQTETPLHPLHPQQRPKPTTLRAGFLSTAAPVSPAARRAPFRPALPRRRRKHRKRISKAALRAMIM